MALQLRNMVFNPSDASLLSDLLTVMAATSISVMVKHAPSLGRDDPFVYEGVGANFILRLEVPSAYSSPANIATLDGAITGASVSLLLEVDGWSAGSDADLRE